MRAAAYHGRMKLQFPFIQLPITFDAAALAAEIEALGDTWHAREDGAPDVYTIGDESHQLIEAIPTLNPTRRGFDSNRLAAADATPVVVVALRARCHAA